MWQFENELGDLTLWISQAILKCPKSILYVSKNWNKTPLYYFSVYLWTLHCYRIVLLCSLRSCIYIILHPSSQKHTRTFRQCFKSTLLFIKATLHTKRWPAKTFLVGDTEPQIVFLIQILLQYSFTVLLPLSTCYFHFKKDWKMWCSQAKDQLLFDLISTIFMLFTDAKWPPQMGTPIQRWYPQSYWDHPSFRST